MVTDVEIYDKICEYRKDHGYSPSIRELCPMIGVKSTSTASKRLGRMAWLNMITFSPRIPRSIVPLPRDRWSDEVFRAEQEEDKGGSASAS